MAQYALLAGPLLAMLDSSIANVAVEPIARELRTSLTTVQWAVSGYLLAIGAGLAATSYLARRYGTLPLYRASLIAFTLASAACALAPNVEALLVARAIQGLVGAPMVPLVMTMMLGGGDTTREVSPLAGILLFLGPALGPSVGGALIGATGWRSIFLINVPVGGVAVFAAARVPVAVAPGRAARARFDLPGLLLLMAGLTTLLFGTIQGGRHGWSAAGTWAFLSGGAVLLVCYAGWAARRDEPALDLSSARGLGSVLALVLCGAASIVTFAAVFVLPVFVQSVQGHSALAAGLAMLPQGIITGAGTALGSRVLTRVSVRTAVLCGFAVLTVASLGLLTVGARTPLALTATILAGRSAAVGLVITPLLTAFLRPLDAGRLADANTLFSIWQRVAGSFGVGLIAALFAAHAHRHGPVAALHLTAIVLTLIAAGSALASILLPPTRNTALGDRSPSAEDAPA
ncbi:DHA2 family efflux MFS transporter permease subunit [Actinoallomurus iriomotensis]|nr:DHA2 family efflux MFS transporter permease subunit [Actinoallomurus iriomotensis]